MVGFLWFIVVVVQFLFLFLFFFIGSGRVFCLGGGGCLFFVCFPEGFNLLLLLGSKQCFQRHKECEEAQLLLTALKVTISVG